MADNYLERRMEEYRSGKLSSTRISSVSVKRPSMQLRVLVIGGDTDLGAKYIKEFRKSNWKVAFTHPDIKSGRLLAQTSGAQHHPISINDVDALTMSVSKIVELWGAIDLVINCTDYSATEFSSVFGLQGIPLVDVR